VTMVNNITLPPRALLDNLREGGLAGRLFVQDYLRYGHFTEVIL
jgi:hypothetical protein